MMRKLVKLIFSLFGKLRRGPYVGACAIVVKDGKILLVKERWGYTLPGGMVDYGEEIENTVVRETKEETGIDVSVKSRHDVISTVDRDELAHSILFLYECDYVGGDLKSSFEGKPEWRDLNDLPTKMKYRFNDVLEKYFKRRG